MKYSICSKTSKQTEYFTYVIWVVVTVIFFSIVFTINTYINHLENRKLELKKIAEDIRHSFEHRIEDISEHMGRMAKQLSETECNNDDIEKHLNELNDSLKGFLNGINLSWILSEWNAEHPANYLVYDRNMGWLPNPTNMDFRTYVAQSHKEPGKLHLSKPAQGHPNGFWEIPAGIGVVNEKQEFIGILSIGFNISELNIALEKTPTFDDRLSFIILDDHYHIVCQSSNNAIEPESPYYHNLLAKNDMLKGSEGFLEKEIDYQNLQYLYFKKCIHFPSYMVLIGWDKNIIKKDFLLLVFPRILELVAMGLFCLFLLYLLRKRIISLTQTSQKAKINLTKQVKSEIKIPINSIIAYIYMLRKYLNGEIDIKLHKNKIMQIMDEIYETSLNLKSFTSNTLEKSYVNVKDALQESITILSHSAFMKEIIFKPNYEEDIPDICVDELKFKQILVGILSLSLDCSTNRGFIKIISQTFKQDKLFLMITIEDSGFCFNKEDIYRFQDKFEENSYRDGMEGLNLSFMAIEKLIHLHNGVCTIDSKNDLGKIIKLTFPYDLKDFEIINFPEKNKTDGVFVRPNVDRNQDKNVVVLNLNKKITTEQKKNGDQTSQPQG